MQHPACIPWHFSLSHILKKNKSEIYFSLSCLQILIYIAKHFTAANGETSPLLTQALCYSLQNPIEIKSTCIQSECGPWSMAEHTLKTTAHILKYIFPLLALKWHGCSFLFKKTKSWVASGQLWAFHCDKQLSGNWKSVPLVKHL